MSHSDLAERVRIEDTQTISDTWATFRRYAFSWLRTDGSWTDLTQEVLEHRDGAAVLPYSTNRGTVFLVRQFRLPIFLRDGDHGLSLEVPGGLLDGEAPDDAVVRELAEETGFRIDRALQVFTGYMAPTLVAQRMHLYVADVDAAVTNSSVPEETEDLEVVEIPIETAMLLIARGEIRDAKTILLIQHARLAGLLKPQP